MKNRELFICECSNREHILIMEHDPEDKLTYVSIHLAKHRFFKRLWHAIKYTFGHRCNYGAFQEIILTEDHAGQLQKVVDDLSIKL